MRLSGSSTNCQCYRVFFFELSRLKTCNHNLPPHALNLLPATTTSRQYSVSKPPPALATGPSSMLSSSQCSPPDSMYSPHVRGAGISPASEPAATLPGIAVAGGSPRVGQHRVDAVPVLLVQCKAEKRLVVRHVACIAGAWAAPHPTEHSGAVPSVRSTPHDQHPDAQGSNMLLLCMRISLCCTSIAAGISRDLMSAGKNPGTTSLSLPLPSHRHSR